MNDQPQADLRAQVAALVNRTPPAMRHLLLQTLVTQVQEHLEPIPASGHCGCGQRLVPGPHQEIETYELDYSIGYQDQTAALTESGAPAITCSTHRSDQHTLADVLCPRCHRLYSWPLEWTKTYA